MSYIVILVLFLGILFVFRVRDSVARKGYDWTKTDAERGRRVRNFAIYAMALGVLTIVFLAQRGRSSRSQLDVGQVEEDAFTKDFFGSGSAQSSPDKDALSILREALARSEAQPVPSPTVDPVLVRLKEVRENMKGQSTPNPTARALTPHGEETSPHAKVLNLYRERLRELEALPAASPSVSQTAPNQKTAREHTRELRALPAASPNASPAVSSDRNAPPR